MVRRDYIAEPRVWQRHAAAQEKAVVAPRQCARRPSLVRPRVRPQCSCIEAQAAVYCRAGRRPPS
jgi:hypothetical protein